MVFKVTFASAPALRRTLFALAAMTVAHLGTPEASAQSAEQARRYLADFNHYVFIANHDLAEANAVALVNLGLTPEQFLNLVEDSPTLQERFDRAYQRALLIPQLEDDAAALYRLYDTGRKERARTVQEIRSNIELLGGNARNRFEGRSRLLEAGEYAVPHLLEATLNDDRIDVRSGTSQLLIELGRAAAIPLCEALPHLQGQEQERVARILGQIPHQVSIPYLYELWATTNVAVTRDAASDAVLRLNGTFDPGASLAALFRDHGEQYYNDRLTGELLAFPNEEHQLIWTWQRGVGLFPRAIRTEVFHEAIAMRSAERALGYDADDESATALWLASNLSRQLRQPSGYDNPMYPASRADADYYAAALGHRIAQMVLERALEDGSVQIARRCIAALRSTAGDASIDQGVDGRRPLLAALGYPDRRVRYDAALALAEADPRRSFEGAERVVPTLAGMITQAGLQYALVMANEPERQQDLRQALEDAGYRVLPPIASMRELDIALADAPGVDLIVADLPSGTMLETRRGVRTSERLSTAPMIALGTGTTLELLRAENDHLTKELRASVDMDAIIAAAGALVADVLGEPLDDNDALIYAGYALGALRDLAVSRNEVLDPTDASATLLETIDLTDGFVRRQIAEVLSYIPRSDAQRRLADAAADAFDASEQGAMLDALAGSARRFGNLLTERHEEAIVDLATKGDPAIRLNAANAAGALGLSGSLTAPILIGVNEG